MSGLLVFGAAVGFVVVVIGLPWLALAILGVLYLLERAEDRS